MLAIRQQEEVLSLRLGPAAPARASIGARRNPESTRAILTAAEAILNEEGLAGLSMDAIARRARCGKPTLYRWWPDRATLLAEIHQRAMVAVEIDSDRTADELIAAWTRAWRTTLAGIALRGLLAEAQSSEPAMHVLHERALGPYRSALERAGVHDEAEPLLASLLGMLLLGGSASPRRIIPPVMREVSAPATMPAPAEETLVHRGEWVD